MIEYGFFDTLLGDNLNLSPRINFAEFSNPPLNSMISPTGENEYLKSEGKNRNRLFRKEQRNEADKRKHHETTVYDV